MSEGKESLVVEHPKAWVVLMVEGRGLKVAEKTLYWWSVHLKRFLEFFRSAGAESSGIPEVAARLFLESLPRGGGRGNLHGNRRGWRWMFHPKSGNRN
jgi:hypothetical protein